MSFIADIFNVTNNRRLQLPDQNRQLFVGQDNLAFLRLALFRPPVSLRLGLNIKL